MNQPEVIRSIQELAELMGQFDNDKPELLKLAGRLQVRLDHLKAHACAGRPDLTASLRSAEQVALEEFLR